MKNKIFLIVTVFLIIAGTVAGYFAVNDTAQLTAFAVTMFGAGLACTAIWDNKKETANKAVVVASMALVGIGAFLAGLTKAITESQVTTIMGLVLSLILIIMGIVASVTVNRK